MTHPFTAPDLRPLTTSDARPTYVQLAAAADRDRWSVERDVRWLDVDRARAYERPDLLAQLRSAALIDSYHPVHLGWMLDDTWDDVDAGAAIALELYEGFKHFHALRSYLDAVGFEPAITDAELLEIRAAARAVGPTGTLIERLVEFMLSEHLASYFFRRVGEQATDPAVLPAVLDAAVHFHHFGEQAVEHVPVALPGDPLAIRSFARRIERLCGVRLVDHLKRQL